MLPGYDTEGHLDVLDIRSRTSASGANSLRLPFQLGQNLSIAWYCRFWPFSFPGGLMGRKSRNSTLLRARVSEETLARVELRLYSQFEGRRKYGELGKLVDYLLQRWLSETEEAARNARS
jgi:hypothetical protein